MKNASSLTLVICLLLTVNLHAQRRISSSYNRLGIQAAVTYGGIETSNFETQSKISYLAGLTTRANVYNNFTIIYGVNFFESRTGLNLQRETGQDFHEIDFKTTGAQLNLFLGHKLIGEHLSFEAGPILQINSKWSTSEEYKNYYVEDYNLQAKDLEDISKIHLNVAANISTGFRSFKFWFQYQYGVTNMFKKLNTVELQQQEPKAVNLEGHIGMALAGVVVYL